MQLQRPFNPRGYRLLMLLLALTSLSLPVSAQVDAKLNAGSALTGGINLAGDIALNEDFSLSLGFGRAVTSFSVNDNRSKIKRWRFVPEARYYFSPKYGADRFFAGAYGRLADITTQTDGSEESVKALRAALGLMAGHKTVTDNNFVFEFNFGIGRGLYFNTEVENDDGQGQTGEEFIDDGLNLLLGLDLRLGIIVGYRFGA